MKVLHCLPSCILPHQVLIQLPQQDIAYLQFPIQNCTEMQVFPILPFNLSSTWPGFACIKNIFSAKSSLRQKLTKDWDIKSKETCICILANFPTPVSYCYKITGFFRLGFLFLPVILGVKRKQIQILVLLFYQVCSFRQVKTVLT